MATNRTTKKKTAKKPKTKAPRKTPARDPNAPPIRLEWRTPEELKDNPKNWRVHPEAQSAGLDAVLGETGWAGAALFNERSGRLIDGHLRKHVDSKHLWNGKIPVIVGDWTPKQERLLLATLDPLAVMAETDLEAAGALIANLKSENEAIKKVLDECAQIPPDIKFPEFKDNVNEKVEWHECPQCGHKWPK